MTTATAERLMTTDDLLALPDDGVRRWLLRGDIQERGMTVRNRFHAAIEAQVVGLLWTWCRTLPRPRGRVVSGEAGFRLARNPDTTAGVDVAYVSAGMAAANPPGTTLYDGPPVLAVEILSPSDTHQIWVEMVREYLAHGVQVVWVIEPEYQTVTVYRPGPKVAALGPADVLNGGAELPGFACPVAELFE